MRTRLELRLRLSSPIQIGSEVAINTNAQKPLLKFSNGLPYIPATSLKGILRHQLEQLLDEAPQSILAESLPQPLSSDEYHSLGVIERLFGTPWLASKVFFSDLYLDPSNQLSRQRSSERQSVTINPRRRVAEDRRLFSMEVFADGFDLLFTGSIIVSGTIEDAALIYIGLRLSRLLGGGKSRGYGWVEIETDVYGDDGELLGREELAAAVAGWQAYIIEEGQ